LSDYEAEDVVAMLCGIQVRDKICPALVDVVRAIQTTADNYRIRCSQALGVIVIIEFGKEIHLYD